MNRLRLYSLANYLAAYISAGVDDDNGCDHTLRRTLAWIGEHDLERGPVLEWLQHRGGWCDCSVVGNICLTIRDEHDELTPALPVSSLFAVHYDD